MTYPRFIDLLTTAMLIAIFTVPLPYANDVATHSAVMLAGVAVGRRFGRRQ